MFCHVLEFSDFTTGRPWAPRPRTSRGNVTVTSRSLTRRPRDLPWQRRDGFLSSQLVFLSAMFTRWIFLSQTRTERQLIHPNVGSNVDQGPWCLSTAVTQRQFTAFSYLLTFTQGVLLGGIRSWPGGRSCTEPLLSPCFRRLYKRTRGRCSFK